MHACHDLSSNDDQMRIDEIIQVEATPAASIADNNSMHSGQ